MRSVKRVMILLRCKPKARSLKTEGALYHIFFFKFIRHTFNDQQLGKGSTYILKQIFHFWYGILNMIFFKMVSKSRRLLQSFYQMLFWAINFSSLKFCCDFAKSKRKYVFFVAILHLSEAAFGFSTLCVMGSGLGSALNGIDMALAKLKIYPSVP